jgi:hypothetical protein
MQLLNKKNEQEAANDGRKRTTRRIGNGHVRIEVVISAEYVNGESRCNLLHVTRKQTAQN